MQQPATLKRSLSFAAVTFYGVGAILGAGIYVLIGELAGLAGYLTPFAFLIAAIIAAFSACSYAELSARFPVSAGEAVYVDEAFHSPDLTRAVGLMVVFTGVVSTATMASGAVGYAQLFVGLSDVSIVTLFLLVIGAIAIWGINESAFIVALITLLEVGGLLYVVAVSADNFTDFPFSMAFTAEAEASVPISGLLVGSFLAFYAFIGFEDMVNIAEEVKRPDVTLPRAIGLALVVSTLIYMAVAISALAVLPPQQLANSSAPLAEVVRQQGHNAGWIGAISLIAVINGAIVQMIMASRVVYGMARKRLLPMALGRIHRRTKTPVVASVICIAVTLSLALVFPLGTLAQATSFIILAVFLLVNISLVWIKARAGASQALSFPMWVPVTGALLCLAALMVKLLDIFSVLSA